MKCTYEISATSKTLKEAFDNVSGVTFGRPGFVVPAINICRRCVLIACTVLGPEPTIMREGRG